MQEKSLCIIVIVYLSVIHCVRQVVIRQDGSVSVNLVYSYFTHWYQT